MAKLIVFDLWQTLAYREVDYSTRVKILEKTGLDLTRDKLLKVYERSVQTKKWQSKYAAYKNFCKNLGLPTTKENVGLLMKIRDEVEARTKLYPFVIPLLKQLRKQGYKIGIASNSSVFVIEIIKKKTDLLDYIDYPLFSFDVGTIKPDLKIYKELLKMAGCQPEEALMIGDSLENDVLAPKSLGMKAIHFKNYEQLKEELVDFGILIK